MRVPIIAYESRHAEYAAREILELGPSQYTVVRDDLGSQLRGLQRGTDVVLVVAKRYTPSARQREERDGIMQVCLAREFQIKRVFLP